MKIFVFGAGASQAAQHELTYGREHPQRAPLMNELFNKQYNDNIVNGLNLDINECRLEVEKTKSLEKWLTNRWDAISAIKTDEKRRAELSWFGNINLYIWNLLNKVSKTYPNAQGYSYLLKKLYSNDEEFALISFNYDTLLDQSYQDIFRRSLSSRAAYLSARLIKLHGSVNWFLKGRDQDTDLSYNRHRNDMGVRIRAIAEQIYNGPPMRLDKLEILDPTHSSLTTINHIMGYFDGYFYPLLFMPLTGKAYSTISDFKEVMIQQAEELFKISKDVYLIGYSANDELIYDLLSKATYGTKLHVIGRQSAKQIAEKIFSKNPNLKEGIINEEGFLNFVSKY
ncbi:hypothetical protein M1328_01025 [Patescibacteria group bacterium]|nr:hypothetical protein [Patescibacteria group bacterium]